MMSRRKRRMRWIAIVTACVAVGVACSSSGTDASPPEAAESERGEVEAEPEPTPEAPTEDPVVADEHEPEELTVTNRFNPLEAGSYRSDHLPLTVELTTTADFNVVRAEGGEIEIAGLEQGDDYFGVAFFEIDTLARSDTNGRQLARFPATTDLTAFLEGLDASTVVDRGRGSIGGLNGDWWRISWPDADACCWEMLFQTRGWQNAWGHPPGYDQVIWAFDVAGGVMVAVVEAPTAGFDDWASHVDEHLFDGLRFGEPTGNTVHEPAGEPFGPYRVGRFETSITDPSRSIEAITEDGRTWVPAAAERELLLSIVYPSPTGGHRSEVSPGPHPIVVSAHALFDAGLTLPPERLLASHGYVVVTIRFPESSFPGSSTTGVLNQPADVSFTLDQVLAGALDEVLGGQLATDRIGVVGASGGATTAFALAASECCADPRITAVVAHAGTPYDFDAGAFGVGSMSSAIPVLQVVSRSDTSAPIDAAREFHQASAAPSTLAAFDLESHIGWLDPESARYGESARLTVGFFDRHLKGEEVDLAGIASQGAFVEFDERDAG